MVVFAALLSFAVTVFRQKLIVFSYGGLGVGAGGLSICEWNKHRKLSIYVCVTTVLVGRFKDSRSEDIVATSHVHSQKLVSLI